MHRFWRISSTIAPLRSRSVPYATKMRVPLLRAKTPLQHVLGVMNDTSETKERRLAAAAIAMPYVHPRRGSALKGVTP